jgi:hypothetical protein
MAVKPARKHKKRPGMNGVRIHSDESPGNPNPGNPPPGSANPGQTGTPGGRGKHDAPQNRRL